MQKCVARAVGVGSTGAPLSHQVISQELTRWNLVKQFGCLVAGRAGAAIRVSLSQALEFLFDTKERSAKELDSR